MVVAVIAARMMKMAVDEVVDVVAVGNRFVATTRTVLVGRVVARAVVTVGATIRVLVADADHVFVDVLLVGVVEVAVVQVVNVPVVLDRRVPTIGAVNVVVVVVFVAVGHGSSLFFSMWDRLVCVLERIVHELHDVFVGDGVVDVAAVPAASDQALGAQ